MNESWFTNCVWKSVYLKFCVWIAFNRKLDTKLAANEIKFLLDAVYIAI